MNSTTKNCKRCGNKFEQTRTWQRFCSSTCRLVFHRDVKKRIFSLIEELAELKSELNQERKEENNTTN